MLSPQCTNPALSLPGRREGIEDKRKKRQESPDNIS